MAHTVTLSSSPQASWNDGTWLVHCCLPELGKISHSNTVCQPKGPKVAPSCYVLFEPCSPFMDHLRSTSRSHSAYSTWCGPEKTRVCFKVFGPHLLFYMSTSLGPHPDAIWGLGWNWFSSFYVILPRKSNRKRWRRNVLGGGIERWLDLRVTLSRKASLHSVEEYKSALALHQYSPLWKTEAVPSLYSPWVGAVFGPVTGWWELVVFHSYSHWMSPPPWISHLTEIVSPLNIWVQLCCSTTTVLLDTEHSNTNIKPTERTG